MWCSLGCIRLMGSEKVSQFKTTNPRRGGCRCFCLQIETHSSSQADEVLLWGSFVFGIPVVLLVHVKNL